MPDQDRLGIAREALVAVSAAIAARERTKLERALRLADRVAAPDSVDEVILQSHLFVGFPIALEAMVAWRMIARRETAEGATEDEALWAARGAEVCRTVYGGNYEKLRMNVAALHPDLDRWMVESGYGRVIGRPQLDLATRELCIAALLAVWQTPRQLHSHLRGALHAGASPAEVTEAMEVACRYLPPERAAEVRQLLQQIAGM